jgi:hypothetical protein
MGSGRKKTLILAYILAVWTTLGLALLFAGALAGMVKTNADEESFGTVFAVIVYLPALAGLGLSVSSIDRKLGTPPVVWGAVIWNLVIFGVLVILTIVGSLK